MTLREGRIASYREVANTIPAFVAMNFAPERIVKLAARQDNELRARDEMKVHLE
jgi:hypothetical protein